MVVAVSDEAMNGPVCVLFGGTSTERRVSVASAQHVASLLPGAELWFLAPSGEVQRCTHAQLEGFARPFETDFTPDASVRWPSLSAALADAAADTTVFVALHGGEGEDGTIQRLLEQRGLAFTGSGSQASALAFDKGRAKAVARAHGITVARGVAIAPGDDALVVLAHAWEEYGPLVAKPIADGSSIGLLHLRSAGELAAAARDIAGSGVTYLVEERIDGTELTVGVLDEDGTSIALPASEVRVVEGGAFDFDGKYLGRGTQEITPAEVPDAVADEAKRIAIAAHRALGCAGYSRTDVIAGPRGVVFLETNTLPGLTRASFIPQQLAAANRPLAAFVTNQLALARARR